MLMKKIDAHAHIGSFGGWAGVEADADVLINNMEEYEIEKTVLCSSGPEFNEDTRLTFEKYPDKFIPLAYLNPLEKNEESQRKIDYYIDKCGFRGIKLNPLKNAYVADTEALNPIMEEAEKRNLPVFIHCGHPPYSLPWSIAFLAERFPRVKVVMIHMGHGHGVYIDGSIKMARRFSNLYLEMSGMPMGSKIKEAYEAVGCNRIMFGTDTPFHHPSVEIQKVLTCGLNEKEQENVFYNNVLRLFE